MSDTQPDPFALPGSITSNTPQPAPMPQGPMHLYIIVMQAYSKSVPEASAVVTCNISDTPENALGGASFANHIHHPDTDWYMHKETPTEVPDDLVMAVAMAIQARTPTANFAADPFAGIPRDLPRTQPQGMGVPFVPPPTINQDTVLSVPAPENPVVAFPDGSFSFR